MKRKIILILAFAMLGFACKPSKNVQKSDDTYRLILTFVSKGEGTDTQSMAALESLIDSFNKKNGILIKYEKYSWGKEGESDWCFKMDGIKKKIQDKFVDSVKNCTKNSQLIFLNENTICKHKK